MTMGNGYTSADVATWGANMPTISGPATGPATQQVRGVATAAGAVASGGAAGNPSVPWVGVVILLVVIRLLAHLRGD